MIDHLHSEVDRLRRGERRGLLRPLLVEMCRLRNDLLRQAEDLPDDFDAERARLLLRSYAESDRAGAGGQRGRRPSRRSRVTASSRGCTGAWAASLPVDPGLAGRVAQVRRDGYLDVDTNSPIAPAEVVLYVLASADPGQPRALRWTRRSR